MSATVVTAGVTFAVVVVMVALDIWIKPKRAIEKCIDCGICEESCPVPEKAVHSGKGQKAKYDYKKCIRCYCCQEMCPVKAIEVYRHPLTRLLSGK